MYPWRVGFIVLSFEGGVSRIKWEMVEYCWKVERGWDILNKVEEFTGYLV